jgi:hypothetical protein
MEKIFRKGRNSMTEHHETIKQAVDAASVVTVVGTLMNVLPAIAAVFSIVWSVIRIYETKTVQDWIQNAKRK